MTRRERAMRATLKHRTVKSAGTPATFKLGASAAIDAYEAELAADLESEEAADRALKAQQLEWIGAYDHERGLVDGMRAALRTVLEGAA